LASIRERALTTLEVGSSFGLSHNRFIPEWAKNYAKAAYTRISGRNQAKNRSWEWVTFGHFWNGDFDRAADELLQKLSESEKIKLEYLDFCARLAWHGAANNRFSISDELQTAFEYQLGLLDSEQIESTWATQGQWLAARKLGGSACISWIPAQRVNELAQLAGRADLSISTDAVTSTAAIRFCLPENWIVGQETEPRIELQSELHAWLRWVEISNDSETLRHARRIMLRQKFGTVEILINEGDPFSSNLALLRNGLVFPSLKGGTAFSPTAHTGLYFLHNSLPWDSQGYSTRSHSIVKALNSQGWKVSAVTRLGYPFDRHTETPAHNVPEVADIDGVTYHRLGRKIGRISNTATFLTAYAERAAELVSELKPAILHAASNHWNGLVANHVARELGLPSIYEVRGLWEVTSLSRYPGYEYTSRYRIHVRLETQAAQDADHVFALTQALKQELIRRGVDGQKITLLPNCVDAARFEPRTRDLELEAQLDVSGKTVIGYVGSLNEYEGLDLLIEAAAELAKTRTDFKVLIVGSGIEQERLAAIVAELNLGTHVIFTGRVPHSEVEKYYSLIDIAPFPRLALPVCEMVSPLKPFEAMAMQKACIVSSVDALTEIVQDGVTGRVFEKNSAADLMRVLGELLDNPSQIREFGTSARSWVLNNRTWEHDTVIAHEIYERLTSKS